TAPTIMVSTFSVSSAVRAQQDVPSDVLLALALGPFSGADEPPVLDRPGVSTVYDRVLARAPGLVPSELIVDLPVLTHVTGIATSSAVAESGSSDGLPASLAHMLRALDQVNWPRATELFHMLGLDSRS